MRVERNVRNSIVLIVSGPDGSGKSTLIDHFEPILRNQGRNLRRIYVRPKILDRVVGRSDDVAAGHGDPHAGAHQLRLPLALAKAIWMGLDAALIRFIRSRMVGEGGVVIVERGIEDIVIDPTRYGLDRLPRSVRSAISQLCSPADRVVLCVCPPELAFARKGETGVAVMRRQYETWEYLAGVGRYRGRIRRLRSDEHYRPEDLAALLAPLEEASRR